MPCGHVSTPPVCHLQQRPEAVLPLVSLIPPGQLQLISPSSSTCVQECIKLICSSVRSKSTTLLQCAYMVSMLCEHDWYATSKGRRC